MSIHPLPADADPPCAKQPDWFFPVDRRNTSEAEAAKHICATCPFSEPCLDYALRVEVAGIWAGTNERDRTRMRREKGITPIALVLTKDDHGYLAPHGTPARYRRHLRNGEKCSVCLDAYRRYSAPHNPSQWGRSA